MQKTGANSAASDVLDAAPQAPAGEDRPRRGRGRLRVQDVRELEAQLITAARDAFMEQGYGATSMASLARSACISKTTLYAKFPTKAALFRAVIERQLGEAYGAVFEAAGDAPVTLAGRLRNLAEKTLQAALEPDNVNLNRLIDWEAPRFPEVAEIARERTRLGVALIATYIREFAEKDQIPCRDAERAAWVFNFMVRGFYHDVRVGALSPSADELRATVERIVTAFLAGRADW